MDRLYLVPVETVSQPGGIARGPKYFVWKYDPDPPGIVTNRLSNQYYGGHPWTLTMAQGISQTDHDFLELQSDVYVYPPLDQLDVAIPGTDSIDTFYEGLNIPTDWMTASNTYREFLRQTMGMFSFHNKYEAISNGHSLFETHDLSTRYRDFTTEEQGWFDATLASYGYDPGIINENNTLRQMLKQAGDIFINHPYRLGDISI